MILLLSFVGLFDSLYLWWAYTSPSHPLVCLGTGCEVARASSYAHLWGVPLPVYGVGLYGVLALLAVAESIGGRYLYPVLRYAMLVAAGAGFVVSLVLTGIEAFDLHAWCAWCVLSAIVVTLILALAIYGVARPSSAPEGASALTAIRGQFVLLIVALIVGIPLFVHLVHVGEFAQAAPKASAADLAQHLVRPDSHATGNLKSPVTVVEFGDFQCPICGLAQQSVERMIKNYGERIRFVFRQFPLTDVHPEAEKAAEASECAAEQGKFWEAEKLFYQKQSDLSVKSLDGYAKQLGLDTKKFDECLSSGRMKSRVDQDIADGKALGVRGTPTFFIGDHRIVGPPQYTELASLIDQQLAVHAPSAPAASAEAAKKPAPSTPVPQSGSEKAQAAPPTSGSNPLGVGSISPLGGAGILSQIQSQSSLACNPDEAKMQQAPLIRTPEAEKLFKGNPKPVFVDVRPSSEFAAGHIPGAINIPVEDMPQKWSTLPRSQTIIFYEGGERSGSPDNVCAFSRAAARIALAHGFSSSSVKVYQDGLKGWKAAGLPVTQPGK